MTTEPQETTATAATDGNDPVAAAIAGLTANLPPGTLLKDVAGPPPAPGEATAYVPPTYAMRTESRQLLHDRALQDIARLRFAFPTEKYKDYKTHVNHPARKMGVALPDGRAAYPDIVVVQHPENNCRVIAEVETNETVREAVARWEWAPYAELAPLYLFVPVGKAGETKALCADLEIPVVGIRTWRYVAGYEEPEINDL
jgi:hypothetical protein